MFSYFESCTLKSCFYDSELYIVLLLFKIIATIFFLSCWKSVPYYLNKILAESHLSQEFVSLFNFISAQKAITQNKTNFEKLYIYMILTQNFTLCCCSSKAVLCYAARFTETVQRENCLITFLNCRIGRVIPQPRICFII